jgi:hypothetical protein
MNKIQDFIYLFLILGILLLAVLVITGKFNNKPKPSNIYYEYNIRNNDIIPVDTVQLDIKENKIYYH